MQEAAGDEAVIFPAPQDWPDNEEVFLHEGFVLKRHNAQQDIGCEQDEGYRAFKKDHCPQALSIKGLRARGLFKCWDGITQLVLPDFQLAASARAGRFQNCQAAE